MQVLDMIHRTVLLNAYPRRIISLVPSQTELLYNLGLDNRVVGITKFCTHPIGWRKTKTIVGGTKKVHLDRIAALNPDLIIANKEENTQEEIEVLANIYPVWVSDISNISEALIMIREVGKITGTSEQADYIANTINTELSRLKTAKFRAKVAYMIWRNPWMTVGKGTFLDDMICRLGWQNVYSDRLRYPETSLEELQVLKPDYVLLPSEPYPFKDFHITEIQKVLPKAKIALVDGEMFCWYGSRMLLSTGYFRSLIEQLDIETVDKSLTQSKINI